MINRHKWVQLSDRVNLHEFRNFIDNLTKKIQILSTDVLYTVLWENLALQLQSLCLSWNCSQWSLMMHSSFVRRCAIRLSQTQVSCYSCRISNKRILLSRKRQQSLLMNLQAQAFLGLKWAQTYLIQHILLNKLLQDIYLEIQHFLKTKRTSLTMWISWGKIKWRYQIDSFTKQRVNMTPGKEKATILWPWIKQTSILFQLWSQPNSSLSIISIYPTASLSSLCKETFKLREVEFATIC